MKNGAYITIQNVFNNQTMRTNSGVVKKIMAQLDVFRQYYNMRLDIFDDDRRTGFIYKVLIRTPFYPVYCHWKPKNDYTGIDFLYIRIETIDRFFIKFLKSVHRQNNKIVIVAEIPTYPYDKEIRTWRNWHVLIKNRHNRKKMHKYIDRIVTFSYDDIIFGIKTIKTINGIDTKSVPIISEKKQGDSINLISVSNMAFWHGLDRLIIGMADYYIKGGNRIINLDIAGQGEEYDNYRNLIKEKKLEQNITMHGFKDKEDLDTIFFRADIAISSLGDHRKGLHMLSALKTREYLARGLPMIASAKIDVLPEDYKYCLYVPENDNPVDINKIINFYDELYTQNDRKEIIRKIRNFAVEHCDMKKTMRPVVDFLNQRL
jgi:glycosyltransferase involved in cell wall biosynthesis